MTKYEAVFIFNNRKVSDSDDGYKTKVEKTLSKYSAVLVSKEDLGRKKFARAIGKKKTGSYWSYIFEMNEAGIAEFQNEFSLDEAVIRLIVFKYDVPEDVKKLELVTQ